MIKLRYKPLRSGDYSLYLDIYSSDSNGHKKRQYEFLQLHVSKDYSKVKNIAAADRPNMTLAEDIRTKRELELVGEISGVKPRQKTTNKSFLAYLNEFLYKEHDENLRTLINHIRTFTEGQDVLFTDVTPQWLDEFQSHLLGRISRNTSILYLSILRARLNESYRNDLIARNPFGKFKMPARQETRRTTLDIEEVKKLAQTPFSSYPQIRQAFLFSCFTGLRISDLKELRWDDIREAVTEKGEKEFSMQIRPIKTQKISGKILSVPLTDSASKLLDEMRKEKNYSGLIFEKLPSERSMRDLIKCWAAKAGIQKDIHFHAARHSFATICLTCGMDIYTVSKLLGHTNVATTEIYAKIINEKKRTEIRKLPIL